MNASAVNKSSPFSARELSPREYSILEAVISAYVSTARPVGSRMLSRMRGNLMGLSPATIRNAMGDLEEKGFLFQPHPSAGRVPTDKAYRLHVNGITRLRKDPSKLIFKQISRIKSDSADELIARAADALSVVTLELGIGTEPMAEDGTLTGVDLIRISSERIMLVLTLDRSLVKTIFIELGSLIDDNKLQQLAAKLRDRLTGLSLAEVRRSAPERLKSAVENDQDPLNVFVQSADSIFSLPDRERQLVLGEQGNLAAQPEFNSQGNLRSLISLTDKKNQLIEIMKNRLNRDGLNISIGSENELSEMSDFTLITDTYRMGRMKGIIGVIGPTRMSYSRVVSVVQYTSRLLSQDQD